jgi:hypothetical protein
MKTIIVQIGNSDDKLTQSEWSLFVDRVDRSVRNNCNRVYFFSTSPNTEPWQNAAWIFDIYENASYALVGELRELRGLFKQDYIVWTEGKSLFIDEGG